MLVNLILKDCNSSLDSILRCLNKATIVIFKDNNYLVADDTHIYYFGLNYKKSKKAYSFYKEVEQLMIGKIFYSRDIVMYKNHCVELNTNINYKNYKKYKWLNTTTQL